MSRPYLIQHRVTEPDVKFMDEAGVKHYEGSNFTVTPLVAIDDEARQSLILLKQFLLHGGELTTAGAERLLDMTERFLSGQ